MCNKWQEWNCVKNSEEWQKKNTKERQRARESEGRMQQMDASTMQMVMFIFGWCSSSSPYVLVALNRMRARESQPNDLKEFTLLSILASFTYNISAKTSISTSFSLSLTLSLRSIWCWILLFIWQIYEREFMCVRMVGPVHKRNTMWAKSTENK